MQSAEATGDTCWEVCGNGWNLLLEVTEPKDVSNKLGAENLAYCLKTGLGQSTQVDERRQGISVTRAVR